jgi:hypothetical protein
MQWTSDGNIWYHIYQLINFKLNDLENLDAT